MQLSKKQFMEFVNKTCEENEIYSQRSPRSAIIHIEATPNDTYTRWLEEWLEMFNNLNEFVKYDWSVTRTYTRIYMLIRRNNGKVKLPTINDAIQDEFVTVEDEDE